MKRQRHGVGTLAIMAMLFWLLTCTSGWSQCPPGRQGPAQRPVVQKSQGPRCGPRHRSRLRHWRPFQRLSGRRSMWRGVLPP